jgi:TolB-like protein/DNA-binding winged helix-turn-helix (wHTH) protein
MAPQTALDVARFACFTLDIRRRTLLANGRPVQMHGRTFDLLVFLVERRDRAVTPAEILAGVWDDRIVGHNNVTVQMSALRKALAEAGGGEPLIVGLPGPRYRFVGDVSVGDAAPPAREDDAGTAAAAPAATLDRPRRRWGVVAVAGGVSLAVAAGWLVWPSGPKAPPLSIAVLPFRNLSPDHAQDYLADAVSDDLTADLGHIPASTVIARESAEAMRQATPQRIGAALNVRYVVSGTVLPEGEDYHVVASLTDAATARLLWSAQIDAKRDRVSALRQEIVRRIASPLQIALDDLESARSMRDRPDNPAAVDLFFRARSALHGGATMKTLRTAQGLLETAIGKAPDFVDAKAGLAWVLLRKVTLADDPDEVADRANAKRLVSEALAASAQNVEALTAQAKLRQIEGDCGGARLDADRVLALHPSNLNVRRVLGACDQADFKLDAAAADYEALLRLDPANPQANVFYVTLGTIDLVKGDYPAAVAALKRGIDREAEPSSAMEPAEQAELMLIAATDLAGDQSEARHLYAAYTARFKFRTVWRISEFFRPSWRRSDGLWKALDGLHDAGMPSFAGEQDAAIADNEACAAGDFAPTPLHLPDGGRVIDTLTFAAQLTNSGPQLVLDVGRGLEAMPGWVTYDRLAPVGMLEFAVSAVRQHTAGNPATPIIVVGDGVAGCGAYAVARRLIDEGYSSVMWYRGGEEAWHRHLALPTHDRT